MSVMGVDPGITGALAHLMDDGSLDIVDMPIWLMQLKGGKFRKRIDAVALYSHLDMAKMLGCDLVMIESVGGRPKQSASAAFQFGYAAALVYMACVALELPVKTEDPGVWKKVIGVPGKAVRRKKGEPKLEAADNAANKKLQEGMIVQRADQLFPAYTSEWRGPRGGYQLDRAEAALLALFGRDYAQRSNIPWKAKRYDEEYQLAYRQAELD